MFNQKVQSSFVLIQFSLVIYLCLKKTDFVISENPKKNLEKDTGMAPKYLENKML